MNTRTVHATVHNGLIVPAYFHPALAGEDWALLAVPTGLVRLVVLNIANGPGHRPDPAFLPLLERLRAAGSGVLGYVDTAYGQRPRALTCLDLRRYQNWYGVSAVFFDRVSTDFGQVAHYAALAESARLLGAEQVVFHHGARPDPCYAEHADLLGVFEGSFSAYQDTVWPQWTLGRAPVYHLVHGVPPERMPEALGLAAERGADHVYLTERGGDNPWDGLPAWLAEHQRHASRGGR
ncbi:spherulation-specific family 4 protein [Goodfellowiella coeruleoviolacea]|uniref:Spherulation-specific family 4 n=1 Tax=Goodfellowiella coeruleoviolacea TaxID=334858 RepID=A0AAE3KG31_9PSEU|nr:spherulation-specific family 4 protein [Goodfellowiella coeruleoviolacea]MCP2165532.1 Spherulation-specific family 4 [Goodfellowiella coeruleoviolacea]